MPAGIDVEPGIANRPDSAIHGRPSAVDGNDQIIRMGTTNKS